MNDTPRLKVLFLCTGNSARSILGEYLLRAMDSRFDVYSAGAEPTGQVHPMAIKVLRDAYGIDANGATSKSWDDPDVDLDVVITVCDHARDTCPLLPASSAIQAHWGSPDPAGIGGGEDEVEVVFHQVAEQIRARLERFCALPFATLERDALADRIRDIGTHQSVETARA